MSAHKVKVDLIFIILSHEALAENFDLWDILDTLVHEISDKF
jgi:hypothetical protein